jgi:hypothetical protein
MPLWRWRRGDHLLEVGKLFAARRAQLLEQRHVLPCLVDLPGLHIELAQIFERALVLGVELERLAIEGIGLLGVAGLAQAEAHEVVDVGMLVRLQHRRQLGDRGLEILGLDLGTDRGEVGRVARGDDVDGERAGSGNASADQER